MPSLGPDARRALIRVANTVEMTADEIEEMLGISEFFYEATGINPITEAELYVKFYVEEGTKYRDLDEDDPAPAG